MFNLKIFVEIFEHLFKQDLFYYNIYDLNIWFHKADFIIAIVDQVNNVANGPLVTFVSVFDPTLLAFHNLMLHVLYSNLQKIMIGA